MKQSRLRLYISPSLCLPLPTADSTTPLTRGPRQGTARPLACGPGRTQRREIPHARREGWWGGGAHEASQNGAPQKWAGGAQGGRGAPRGELRPGSRCFRVSARVSRVRARPVSAPMDKDAYARLVPKGNNDDPADNNVGAGDTRTPRGHVSACSLPAQRRGVLRELGMPRDPRSWGPEGRRGHGNPE